MEALIAVAIMKSSMACNITSDSPLKVNRRFGGSNRLRIQS
jgi:hypothetical protein